MYSILRSVGILLVLMGIGSFVLPKFKRDSTVWQSLGSARNPVMIVSILAGAGLFVLSYRMQMAAEREAAARRRAARDETAREATKPEPEYDDDVAEPSVSESVPETVEANPVSEWQFPKPSADEPAMVEAGSVIVSAKSAATPEVVAEYSPIAQEKAGSESVVIEKSAVDPASRPLEKSPSSILQPVAEKRMQSRPAFEEDPESIFDELPQKPPQSLN